MRKREQMTWKERAARRSALAELPLTAEERVRWTDMMHQTWHAIAPDAMEAVRLSRQKLTRAIIVEYVCDANRVQQFGDMTDEEYEFMLAIYDRPAVQRWMRQTLNYC